MDWLAAAPPLPEEQSFIDRVRRIYRVSTKLISSVKELNADLNDQYMNYIRGYAILCGYSKHHNQSGFWELVSQSASRVAHEYNVLRYFNPVGQITCIALSVPHAIAFPENHLDETIALLAEFNFLLTKEQSSEKEQARMSYEILLEEALLCRFHFDDPLLSLQQLKQLDRPENKHRLAHHVHKRIKQS